MGSLNTLAGGLLGLISALGIGCGFSRWLGRIPTRWQLAVALVSGVAIIDWVVMLALFLGGGVATVKIMGAGCAVLGSCLLLVFWKRLSPAPDLRSRGRSDRAP